MARAKAMDLNVRPRFEEEHEADLEDEYEDDTHMRFNNVVDYYPESVSEDETLDAHRHSKVDTQIPAESEDSNSESDSEAEDGSAGEEDGEEAQQQISRTSFGALKQAHDVLSKKRKRGSDTNENQEEKLAALRSRLKDLRSKPENAPTKAGDRRSDRPRTSSKVDQNEDDEGEDSDSAPSEEGAPSKSRTSKHAPANQSSKYQVTRKRNVIDVPKRTYRDPRFDAMYAQPGNLQDKSEKAYSFLDDYQKSEIKELKAAIKATKNEDEKETLRRKMVSMENRLKSKAAKERERDVVRKHRREEREKVDQGKQPYYLKQKDIKQKALEEKFKGMKAKEREKLMERRRKKEGQKEKKMMPRARRVE